MMRCGVAGRIEGAILQGDCEKLLRVQCPEAGADLYLTDPPYGISRKTGFSNTKDARYAGYAMDFGNWDAEAARPRLLAKQAQFCLRPGGTAIVFYDWLKISDLAYEFECAGFSKLRLIVWQKTNPVPINAKRAYLSNAREVALCAVKGNRPAIFNSNYDPGFYSMPQSVEGERVHPTQKPLALMDLLVGKHSNPGNIVVDPYCGSGTTCLAAKRAGRYYIGIEIDAAYCAAARARLKDAQPVLA